MALTEPRPEMVGATDHPIRLGAEETVARLSLSRPSGPMLESVETAGMAPQVFLKVENITGIGKPVSFALYLNVPDGDEPEQHPELFAGILPMFGLQEASRTDSNHAGSGLRYSLNITPVVRRLEAQQGWGLKTVRVSFVPRPNARGLLLETPERTIQVGRVSVYLG